MTVTSLLAVDALYSEETWVAICSFIASGEPVGTNDDHRAGFAVCRCTKIRINAPTLPIASITRTA